MIAVFDSDVLIPMGLVRNKVAFAPRKDVLSRSERRQSGKDDKVLAAAVESDADYVVSEDRHLRDLKEYEGIPILSRDEFTAELDRRGA